MTQEEIIATAKSLTPRERIFMRQYLNVLDRIDDVKEWKEEMARRRREMEKGKYLSMEEVEALHQAMEEEGL